MSGIKIGIIGDFNADFASHLATNEALRHTARFLGVEGNIQWLATDTIINQKEGFLDSYGGFWCSPGSPYKSKDGALSVIRFARENNIPFIGT